jgi:putative flippase GtrA
MIENIKTTNFKQFVIFMAVGFIGFVIDALLLTYLSQKIGLSLLASRVLSFSAASTITWLLNRKVTFKTAKATHIEYLKYNTVQLLGAGINFSIFIVIVEIFEKFEQTPIIPLGIGAIFSMAFNFIGAKLWVYKHKWKAYEQL